MRKRKYILKEGVILKPYGVNSKVDNSNLTDAMAELFLKAGKATSKDFIITRKTNKNGNSK